MTPFEAALVRRLDPTSLAPLVVAFSGGGDSTALLHLTLEWARRPVIALTVDHGLNPESAHWTAEAGEHARAMGADWRALRWEGVKPGTGVQAKARAARHVLLASAAREAGAKVVLMGHTLDDVLEGDAMRTGDAPGLGRLREWSPSPVWPEGRGVFLLRPMLSVGRQELRDYLRARDAAWLDDPANEDLRYARVRAREFLQSAHPRGSGDPERAAGRSADLGPKNLANRSDKAKIWVPASAGMSGVEWNRQGAEVHKRWLTPTTLPPLLLSVSGRTMPPRSAEVTRLLKAIDQEGVATLSGCRVDARSEVVRINRAPPRRGEQERPSEPVEWVRNRFEAALGLYPDEASIPPP